MIAGDKHYPPPAHLDGVTDSHDWRCLQAAKHRIRGKLRHEISSNVQPTRVTVHMRNAMATGHGAVCVPTARWPETQ